MKVNNFPNIFIIILNWNGWQDTIECLESLQKITYPNYQIIIVDNGSSDNSVKKIKKWCSGELPIDSIFIKFMPELKPVKFIEYDEVTARKGGELNKENELKNMPPNRKLLIIQTNENLGFAGGNNLGIKYALKRGAEYILLLNNDTVVDENIVANLMEPMRNDPKIGIVGAVNYYYTEPNKIWGSGAIIQNWWINSRIDISHNKIDAGQFGDFRNVDYIPGSCMSIKKEVFEKIGLFDERFFLDFEETDFSIRAKRAGYDIVSTFKAKIWHKVSKAKGKQSANKGNITGVYFYNRNIPLFLIKNSPKICLITSLPLHFSYILFRYFKTKFFSKEKAYNYMLKRVLIDSLFYNYGKGSLDNISEFNQLEKKIR